MLMICALLFRVPQLNIFLKSVPLLLAGTQCQLPRQQQHSLQTFPSGSRATRSNSSTTCIQVFQRDFILKEFHKSVGFPGGSDGKESACSVGDPGSIPGSGRSPGEGNGNPLQYSCLENPTDRRAWWATVHEVLKSQTRLSDFTYFHFTNLYFLMQFYPKQISPNSVQVKDCLKL